MTENFDKHEMNLEKIFDYSLNNQKKEQIWRAVERKNKQSKRKQSFRLKFSLAVLGVLTIIFLALGPKEVFAQIRTWLIPNYRPISQLEDQILSPVADSEEESPGETLKVSLLSAISTENELKIVVDVRGFDPSSFEDGTPRHFEQAYIILPDGKRIDSIGSSFEHGNDTTDFVLEIDFPAVGKFDGEEIQLFIPDLPFKENPFEQAWKTSLVIDAIDNEKQTPEVEPNFINLSGEAPFTTIGSERLSAEIIKIKQLPAKETELTVKVNLPESFYLMKSTTFWQLTDDQGFGHPLDYAVVYCENSSPNTKCPPDEIQLKFKPALPGNRSYTLDIYRINMALETDSDFYMVDGEPRLKTFLTVEFPQDYQAGDFITIDQWHKFGPYDIHILGIEILQAREDSLRFRFVMQSPQAVGPLALCINRVGGGSCSGESRDGLIPPDPEEYRYFYNNATTKLSGLVEFYLQSLIIEEWTDLHLEFSLD